MHKVPLINWFDKNTVKHLRISFSFFLLPVFLFALSQAPEINWIKAVVAFCILHLLIFPSSNGYNSYQDRDETSIGGLKNPPKVTRNLFYVTCFLILLEFYWRHLFQYIFHCLSLFSLQCRVCTAIVAFG